MRTRTIGVEIELTGITRRKAADTVATYFNSTFVHKGGTYDTYEVSDDNGRIWNIKRDSSITPQKKGKNGLEDASDNYKVELITPILNYADIEPLQEIVRKISKAGGFVNQSSGLHIHIGAKDFTAQAAHNLVNAIASKEDLLYKALNVYERRKQYCEPTNRRFLKQLNERNPQTLVQLAAIWYNESETTALMPHSHYHISRYTICNLHAFFEKGTVEFRVFNSTLDAGEIKAAIQFCLALMHQAKTTKKAIYRPTITDNEKYTFRCWLLRLGLNGAEFQECRYHLLKHLEGNAAWRNAQTA